MILIEFPGRSLPLQSYYMFFNLADGLTYQKLNSKPQLQPFYETFFSENCYLYKTKPLKEKIVAS